MARGRRHREKVVVTLVVVLAAIVVIKEGVLLLVRVDWTRSKEVLGGFLFGLLTRGREEGKFVGGALLELRIVGSRSKHVEGVCRLLSDWLERLLLLTETGKKILALVNWL